MFANYHTHTPRCHHAVGTPREYVEKAIKSGLKILGFSDHVPYPFGNGYISPTKMSVEETGDYVKEILSLKEEYKDQIEILIGYEAEYYPACFDAMLENICRFPCDYLILGQHFLGNGYDDTFTGILTEDKGRLTRYVDQVLAAMDTGKFSYIAHPDVLRYRGDDTFYRKEMERLCVGAKELSIPLEINFLGIMDHRHYPDDRFWAVVKDVGNDVVFGCDAHDPRVLTNSLLETKALALAERYGLHVLKTVKLKPISRA